MFLDVVLRLVGVFLLDAVLLLVVLRVDVLRDLLVVVLDVDLAVDLAVVLLGVLDVDLLDVVLLDEVFWLGMASNRHFCG